MSETKRGKKRPKSYYLKCAGGGKKTKNDLAAGMKGFLVTCNKYERETVREMYNVLNEYADKLYGPEVKPTQSEGGSDSGSDEEDMEKAMAKETAQIKQVAQVERRFQNTDTKTKNLIFIRTTVEDPCDLAHKIFSDIMETQVQKARYALRLIPIAATCKATIEKITETATQVLKPAFETSFGVGIRYTSLCKIRNNQSLSRKAILPSLGKIVNELNPMHVLCHDDPELCIVVEVIRNICCITVVKDFFKFRKYNFHQVIKKAESGEMEVDMEKSESKSGSDDENEEEESDEDVEEADEAETEDTSTTEKAGADAGMERAEQEPDKEMDCTDTKEGKPEEGSAGDSVAAPAAPRRSRSPMMVHHRFIFH